MRRVNILIALACSLLLTYLTVTPPMIPTDWARLDAAGVYVPQGVDYPWPSYAVQAGLWVVMAAAVSGKTRVNRGDARDAARHTTKTGAEIWILAGMTLVGFGLRLHTLDALPLIMDEIGFAAHASDILHGQHVPIFAPGHNANPSAYSWLTAGAMALFGQNTFAIRLLPLAFGTLSIAAVYALGRAWWSRRVGLLAAAFVATYPAHIFFSRMSLYNLVDPFFVMLALACLPRPGKMGQAAPLQGGRWMMAGVLVGVAQYFYHGSRLALVLMALYVGLWVMGRPRTKVARPVLWMAGAFAIVTLPRFAPLLFNRLPVTGNEQTMRLPADLGANTARAALAWVGQPDVSPFWLSDAPLLQWPALLAFGVGMVVSIWRWRDPRCAVLIAVVALTTIFGAAIWTAAPLYVRYITALPAIALLVAVGLSAVGNIRRGGNQRAPHQRRRHLVSLPTVMAVLIALQGGYAALQQPGEAVGWVSESQWAEHDLALQAASLSPGEAAALVVPAEFSAAQRITISHYVAALGERRAVVVNLDGGRTLTQQAARLKRPYTVLRAR